MGNLFLFLLQSVFQVSLEIKENKKAAGMKKKKKKAKQRKSVNLKFLKNAKIHVFARKTNMLLQV